LFVLGTVNDCCTHGKASLTGTLASNSNNCSVFPCAGGKCAKKVNFRAILGRILPFSIP